MLRVLAGEALTPTPIWLMRQAGRYLPEYRAIRGRVGGFSSCATRPRSPPRGRCSRSAVRFRRVDFVADILVVPDALARRAFSFEGEGPRLDASGRKRIGRA